MSLPTIFDYLPDQAEDLVKTALSAGLMGQLKGTAGAGAKIGLKRGGEQFAARSFNAEAAALKPKAIMGTVVPDPFKVAFVEEKPKPKEKPPVLSKATVMSALKTTVPYVAGVGLGSGLGYGAWKGLEAFERSRGKPLISPEAMVKYGPMAFTALGGLLAAREAAHRRKEREIWRRADESAQNRATGSSAQ